MAVSLNGPDNIWTTTRDNIAHIGDELNANQQIVRLEDTYQKFMNSNHVFWVKYRNISDKLRKIFNSVRIFDITIINYGILSMFGYLLVRLTLHYHQLYTRSSLLATIATNIVLYGISDALAQSLSQFFESNHPRRWFTYHGDDLFSPHSRSTATTITLTNDVSRTASEEEINVFVDYGDDDADGMMGAQPYDPHGNISNYQLDSQLSEFDFRRFFGFVTWGFVMAFIQVLWYMFLNAMFNDMPTMVSVLERDLTDQLLFSPISLACFFAYTTIIIEGKTVEEYKDKMYKIYIMTYAVSFSVWFPVQFINFSIMPKKFQVPFSSSVGVIWNCYLSYSNAKSNSN